MGPLSLGSSGRSSSRSGGVSQQGSGRSQLSGGGSQGSSSARSVRSLDLSESAFMQYQSDAGSGGGGGFVASDPLRRGTGAGRGSATSRVSGGGSRDTTMSRGELSPEGRDRVERWRSGISGSRRFSQASGSSGILSNAGGVKGSKITKTSSGSSVSKRSEGSRSGAGRV